MSGYLAGWQGQMPPVIFHAFTKAPFLSSCLNFRRKEQGCNCLVLHIMGVNQQLLRACCDHGLQYLKLQTMVVILIHLELPLF